jgi:hypothetical protein
LELTPQSYNQYELQQVADDQDRQNCFYCGQKSHLEWEQRTEALPYFGHAELEPIKETNPDKLIIGEFSLEQRTALTTLLDEYRDTVPLTGIHHS